MTCRYAAEGKYLDFDVGKQKSKDPRLSVTDCARRAQVAICVVNGWLDDGEIEPSHVTCGRRFVRQSDLDRFLQGRVDG